jgi:hypothetical protein
LGRAGPKPRDVSLGNGLVGPLHNHNKALYRVVVLPAEPQVLAEPQGLCGKNLCYEQTSHKTAVTAESATTNGSCQGMSFGQGTFNRATATRLPCLPKSFVPPLTYHLVCGCTLMRSRGLTVGLPQRTRSNSTNGLPHNSSVILRLCWPWKTDRSPFALSPMSRIGCLR